MFVLFVMELKVLRLFVVECFGDLKMLFFSEFMCFEGAWFGGVAGKLDVEFGGFVAADELVDVIVFRDDVAVSLVDH